MGALFYKLASFLVNRLPLTICYWVAERLADIYYSFASYSRKVVRSNLEHIFRGKISREELRLYVRETFREFSKYLVAFFKFPSLNKNNIDQFITLENLHYIDEALKAGKGVIALTAHFGNWELGGITMGLKGYPMNAIALNHKNKAVNRFFINQRESKRIKNIPLGAALRRCFEAFQQNEILALLGDREFNRVEMGIKINFCGKETRACIPKGAAKFALKTGVKIVPCFVFRGQAHHSKLVFSQPLEIAPGGNEEKDIQKIMEDFFAIFENFVKQYPSQWFVFYPLWEEIK